MTGYILRRLAISLPVFIGITAIVFILANLAPGSPLDILAASGNLTEAQLHDMEVAMGLDKPVVYRYLAWLWDVVHFDLGESDKTSQDIAMIISQRIGPSLLLSLTSLAFTLIIGISLGLASAYRPYSLWDSLASALAFIGSSVPSFFVSLLLIYFFAVKLGLLPAQGMYSNSGNHGIADLARHMVLPVFVMVLQSCGGYIKQTRSSVLEVIHEDFVKTARSKGIPESSITWNHTLRNAWIPIATQLSLSIPFIIGGAVVTEQIFGWPGMGSLMIQAIATRDYKLIMGITVLISIVVLLANLVLDIAYAFLDPRIRKQS